MEDTIVFFLMHFHLCFVKYCEFWFIFFFVKYWEDCSFGDALKMSPKKQKKVELFIANALKGTSTALSL